MSDTRALIDRVSSLRQRLANVQDCFSHADTTTADILGNDASRLRDSRLADEKVAAFRVPMPDASCTGNRPCPSRITSRFRQSLVRCRTSLQKLRHLSNSAVFKPRKTDDSLTQYVRQTIAMCEATIRFAMGFPDSPDAQLRLCDGLNGLLSATADRIDRLAVVVQARGQAIERMDTVVQMLTRLQAGTCLTLDPITALAEAVVADARQGEPLRFYHADPVSPASDATTAANWQARMIAAHGLTTAEVVARMTVGTSRWKDRALLPVVAALLHDVGMLAVPFEIVGHPGYLTDGRRTIVAHCQTGAEWIAASLPNSAPIAEAIAQHHERLDGTGYPTGRRDMDELARLLAVADVYAALVSPRPHRGPLDPRIAMTNTVLLAEQGRLDREAARMLQRLSYYPPGVLVELSDGSAAVVVATHDAERDLAANAAPVVALLADVQGHPWPTPKVVDLARVEDQSILRQLSSQRSLNEIAARYPELMSDSIT